MDDCWGYPIKRTPWQDRGQTFFRYTLKTHLVAYQNISGTNFILPVEYIYAAMAYFKKSQMRFLRKDKYHAFAVRKN